jgi:hypothetical protein
MKYLGQRQVEVCGADMSLEKKKRMSNEMTTPTILYMVAELTSEASVARPC